MHYRRWQKYRDTSIVRKQGGRPPTYFGCVIEGCERPHAAREMCELHYRRALRGHSDPGAELLRSGEHHPQWAGDDASYHAAHFRIYKARGKAREYTCICGAPAEEWAYDYKDPNERTGPVGGGYVGVYSVDADHYDPMCRSCHRFRDWAHRKASRPPAAQ